MARRTRNRPRRIFDGEIGLRLFKICPVYLCEFNCEFTFKVR